LHFALGDNELTLRLYMYRFRINALISTLRIIVINRD